MNGKNKKTSPAWAFFINAHWNVQVCLVILVIFFISAAFAPILTPYTETEQELKNAHASISVEHWLGTDHLGRDTLTRLLYGARVSLVTSLFSCVLGSVIGMLLGVAAGYSTGVLRAVIMRATDAMLSLPPLLLCMVLALVFGGGIIGVGIVIGIALIPTYIRVVYSLVITLRENDYVVEAKLLGLNSFGILLRHLLPNCFPTVIVVFTMNLGQAMMIEASLSYLGLGIVAPTPAWGSMVAEGYKYLTKNPLLAILPGICILLIIVAFNIVGDALRDTLDPRLRGKL